MTYQELSEKINTFTQHMNKPHVKYGMVTKQQALRIWYGYAKAQEMNTPINPTYAYMSAKNLSHMQDYISIGGRNNGKPFMVIIKNTKKVPIVTVEHFKYLDDLREPLDGKAAKKYRSWSIDTPDVIQGWVRKFALTPIKDRHLPYSIKTVTVSPVHDMLVAIKRIWNKEVK